MHCCLHIRLSLWELRFPWLWKFKLLYFGLQGHVASPLLGYKHFKATYCLHFRVMNMCQLKNFFTNTAVLWMCNNVKHLECVRSSSTEILQIPMLLTVCSPRCRFMYSKYFHHDVPHFNTEQVVPCTYVCKTVLYLQFMCSSWHVCRSLDKICD